MVQYAIIEDEPNNFIQFDPFDSVLVEQQENISEDFSIPVDRYNEILNFFRSQNNRTEYLYEDMCAGLNMSLKTIQKYISDIARLRPSMITIFKGSKGRGNKSRVTIMPQLFLEDFKEDESIYSVKPIPLDLDLSEDDKKDKMLDALIADL